MPIAPNVRRLANRPLSPRAAAQSARARAGAPRPQPLPFAVQLADSGRWRRVYRLPDEPHAVVLIGGAPHQINRGWRFAPSA